MSIQLMLCQIKFQAQLVVPLLRYCHARHIDPAKTANEASQRGAKRGHDEMERVQQKRSA